jgi:myosin-1
MNIVPKQGMPDFVMLDTITEDSFMKNLSVRFDQKQIYTYIGEQIVAMNPFTKVDMYTKPIMETYRNMELYEVQPHIFALSDDTFRCMMRTKSDQCVLITGESGAGKTEASKIFMQYIVHISATKGDAEHIKQRLLDSNPVLEAFGNAKTVRNDNSSRFGKYMEIQFQGAGAPIGGRISQYLLEKSRVVTRSQDERMFHIFYQMLANKKVLKDVDLTDDHKSYKFMAVSGSYQVSSIHDEKDLAEVEQAMQSLDFQPKEVSAIWRILAGILKLGNVEFVDAGKDKTKISNLNVLQSISKVLCITTEQLEKATTTNVLETAGSKTIVELNPKASSFSRDSMAKGIYTKLFDWVVEHINASIQCQGSPEMVIGVLDIYGFEIFQNNSFEQFCINYCNEKLQQLFIKLVLQQEQEEYHREGIEWKEIDYFNNAPIVDLIEGNPTGMFRVLDEACMVGNTSPGELLTKLDQTYAKHPHYESFLTTKDKALGREAFRIKHYAGDVDYQIEEFVYKNQDSLYRTIREALQSSSDPLIKSLFPVEPASKKRPVSAGEQFKRNVTDLITKLNACQPHYIRTIKSNDAKRAFNLNDERVRHQVRYLNLVETVRVRRAGFCNRQLYTRFLPRYKMISPKTWPKWEGDPKQGCKHILDHLKIGPEEYRLGKTKVFIRNASTLTALEVARDQMMHEVAFVIQRRWRALHTKGIVARYVNELLRAFPKGTKCNFGFDAPIPWPSQMAKYEGYSKKLMTQWRQACQLLSMTPWCQSFLRQKVRTYNIFAGKKPYICNEKFAGDYLGLDAKTGNAYKAALPTLLSKLADTEVIFACLVNKVNRPFATQLRAMMMTDRHLVKLLPGKFKQQKEAIPLNQVEKILMSPQVDTYCVVKCKAPTRDLLIDLGPITGQGNHLAEFVTIMVQRCSKMNRALLPVEIGETLSFNQNRTAKARGVDVTLTFARNPAPKPKEPECVCKKLTSASAQILFSAARKKCARSGCSKDSAKGNWCAEHVIR